MQVSHLKETIETQTLSLRPPAKWDDHNDSFGIEHYKTITNMKSVYVSCMTMSSETHHHWNMFAKNDGVCICINRQKLEEHLKNKEGLSFGEVNYLRIKEIPKHLENRADRLPFIKRINFADEREYRVVFATDKYVPVDKSCGYPIEFRSELISGIKFSPDACEAKITEFKGWLSRYDSCTHITASKSRLTDSIRWQNQIKAAFG